MPPAASTSSTSAASRALAEKDKGNALFKQGDYVGAIGSYTRAILIDGANTTLPLNRSQAYLKLSKFADCERDCAMVLEREPKNVKALFRRGLARKGLGSYESAVRDFEATLAADATNQSAKDELEATRKLDQDVKAGLRRKAEKAAAVRAPAPKPATSAPAAAPRKAPKPYNAATNGADTAASLLDGKALAVESSRPAPSSDDTLMRAVSTRKLDSQPSPDQPSPFAAARQAREAREARQRGSIGLRTPLAPPQRDETPAAPVAAAPASSSAQPKVRAAPVPAPSSTSRPAPTTAFDFTRAWKDRPAPAERWALLQSIRSFPALFGANLEPDLLAQIIRAIDSVRHCGSRRSDFDGHRSLPALRLCLDVSFA